MNIDIHQPELEALIQQRLDTGQFESVEDLLLQALRNSPEAPVEKTDQRQNLADFLLESPLPGSGLLLERTKDSPRVIDL